MDRTELAFPPPPISARPTSVGPFRPDPVTIRAHGTAVVEFERRILAGENPGDFMNLWECEMARLNTEELRASAGVTATEGVEPCGHMKTG